MSMTVARKAAVFFLRGILKIGLSFLLTIKNP